MLKERVSANGPLMSRRALLAAAPIACLPMAASTAGPIPALDPVVPLYREWLAARVEWLHFAHMPEHRNWDTFECKSAEAREEAARRQIVSISPSSIEGVAAIACLLWDEHGPGSCPTSANYQDECDEPTSRMIAALWRYATGLEGLPQVPK